MSQFQTALGLSVPADRSTCSWWGEWTAYRYWSLEWILTVKLSILVVYVACHCSALLLRVLLALRLWECRWPVRDRGKETNVLGYSCRISRAVADKLFLKRMLYRVV
jgi:hypothetical protein